MHSGRLALQLHATIIIPAFGTGRLLSIRSIMLAMELA
jgi:hypothetical protein